MSRRGRSGRWVLCGGLLCCLLRAMGAQTTLPTQALPDAPQAAVATLAGSVTDTDGAVIPGTKVTLEESAAKVVLQTTTTNIDGEFEFKDVAPARYTLRFKANGFSGWKVENVDLPPAGVITLPVVELGVEAIDASVNAIFSEDLAEQEITAEEHQRILGVLPNFFVSYVPHAQPLTKRQKFKLAAVVSVDPLTFMTTGITAGIEQAEGDFAGYGPGPAGYAQRYAASYADRVDATFLGAAVFPSLLHQDPRYFYSGKGSVVRRALYAISTVVICKGDNGRWQPNYSNVLGNLAAGGISSFYYPNSAKHDVQTSVDNIFIGIGEGSIGTLFQEFLLRHVTHGAPPVQP